MNFTLHSLLALLAAMATASLALTDNMTMEFGEDLMGSDSYRRPQYQPAVDHLGKPAPNTEYDVTPGMYNPGAGGGALVGYDRPYDQKGIYYRYLAHPSYAAYNKNCKTAYSGPLVLTKDNLNQAFAYAITYLNHYRRQEQGAYSKGNYVQAPYTSATARHQGSSYVNRRSPSYRKEIQAMFMEQVSKFLTKYHCLNPMQTNFMLPNTKIVEVVKTGYVDGKCSYSYGAVEPQSESCGRYGNLRWRSEDGTCNNLKHKYWGRANVCHLSLLPKAYDDGIASPRTKGTSGYVLPPARIVANNAHHPWNSRAYYTNMKMQWGQWINHDITNTPSVQAAYGGMIECCKNPYHPECFPIRLPKGDYQEKYGKNCMDFVRSTPCPLCVMGPRQQMNSITSHLDASGVYGSTKEDSQRLRTYSKGMLKFSKDRHGYTILPVTKNAWADQCNSRKMCFDAGDVRSNQHPTLMAVHSVWLRQHNRLALELYRLYPAWSDELIYQTVRQIVIAQIQHITYKEYLPIVLGPDLMNYYDLTDRYGMTRYNPYTDPTSWNEYAAAACRFGHSQIPNWFSMVGGSGKHGVYPAPGYRGNSSSGYWLRDSFFNSEYVHGGMTEQLILGLVTDNSMTSDPWIENDVRNYLYRSKKNPGLDLAAINIQRGRDHGLPGYIYYVQYCFNKKITTWSDLAGLIPPYQLNVLRKTYNNYIEDIDLFTGLMSEKKVVGGDVGPTSACINGIQWHHIKFGDRFFYSHGYLPSSLTKEQLANVKATNLASVMCKNTYIDRLQPELFFPASNYNRPVPCARMPDINLSLWAKAGKY